MYRSPGIVYAAPPRRRRIAARPTAATGVRRRRRRRVGPTTRAPTSRYGRRRTTRRTRGTRGLTASELQAMQQVYGGNFFRRLWRGVKRVARPVHKFVKDNKLVSKGLRLIPNPAAQRAAAAADVIGYGRTRGGARGGARRSTRGGVRRVGGAVLVY